ncbi:hypothetical protein P4B35_08740 [Pontiellaceae bacterium B12227]|nr:hypothetical protein [Pontiellaceae bacterium B12227]
MTRNVLMFVLLVGAVSTFAQETPKVGELIQLAKQTHSVQGLETAKTDPRATPVQIAFCNERQALWRGDPPAEVYAKMGATMELTPAGLGREKRFSSAVKYALRNSLLTPAQANALVLDYLRNHPLDAMPTKVLQVWFASEATQTEIDELANLLLTKTND